MGPVLFLYFIYDLPSSFKEKTILFVDNTTLLTSQNTANQAKEFMGSMRSSAGRWFSQKKLKLNKAKTSDMIFSTSPLDAINSEKKRKVLLPFKTFHIQTVHLLQYLHNVPCGIPNIIPAASVCKKPDST